MENCTEIGLVLHRYCTEIGLVLHRYCTEIGLVLHGKLYRNRIGTPWETVPESD